jgi:hypothetical protein
MAHPLRASRAPFKGAPPAARQSPLRGGRLGLKDSAHPLT